MGSRAGISALGPEHCDASGSIRSDSALGIPQPLRAVWKTRELRVPVILFFACLAAQLYLVFSKAFNWDEFIHFSQVYQLKAGTLLQSFQVFHLRLLGWAPEVSANLFVQMWAARLFMWGMHLLTLGMIYGVARRFTDTTNAFFASFAYLTAGYVFGQGFSIRADPVVTATLMSALFLLVRGRLSLGKVIASGALIGLAGMMTFKAAFYAPCFAGLLWLRFRESPNRAEFLGRMIALAGAAFLSFAAIYLVHTAGFASAPKAAQAPTGLSFFARWVSEGVPFARFIGEQVILAPVFVLCLALAPIGWRRAGLKASSQVALAGFIAPLLVLLFYRNTFPYFFVFILAPAAIAIAPALSVVRGRFGSAVLALILSAIPLSLAALEPREMSVRQRALIEYVHREFPRQTGYLDYSGMIANYPRVLQHLTSGIGIRAYYARGDAVVAREIERGNVPFIIANFPTITAALKGRPTPETFLPADVAAMNRNYVQQWGVLWREGERIPAGAEPFEFHLSRDGAFVLDGKAVTIDGVTVTHGETIRLREGRHDVAGGRNFASTLWRGEKLPTTPPNLSMDRVFARF